MPPADTRRVVPTPPHALRRAASSRHCACTFYLVFKEPATWWFASSPFGLVRDHVPHQLYFLEGNLAILQSAHPSVNPFLAAASILFEALSRGSHRCRQRFHRVRWVCALEVRLGSASWRKCFDFALTRVVGTGHARSNQYTRRVRACQHRQPPELSARQNPRNWLAGRTLKSPRRSLAPLGPFNDAKGKYIPRGSKRNPAEHFFPPRPQLTFNRNARRPISTTCSSPRRRNSL